MAGRLEGTEKRPSAVVAAGANDIEMQPKKSKQARLPFKPLDFKSLASPSPCTASGNGSKKRKLSGPDSPHLKSKMQKSHTDTKQSTENGKRLTKNENEVSSSSEAENLPAVSVKASRGNTLEKFVCRESLQEEITSTNVIDLTDSNSEWLPEDENKHSPVKSKSPPKTVCRDRGKVKLGKDFFVKKLDFNKTVAVEQTKIPSLPESECQQLSKDDSSALGDSGVQDTKMMSIDCTGGKTIEEKHVPASPCDVLEHSHLGNGDNFVVDVDEDEKHQEYEQAEGTTLEQTDLDIEQETDSSLSLSKKTDAKEKTPRRKRVPLSASTPITSASASSSECGTPSSTKKPRSKQSSGKHTERAALRLKVKEEKERHKREEKEKREKERLEQKQLRDSKKAEKERQKREEKEKKEKERQDKKERTEKEKQEKQQQKEEEKKKKQEVQDAKMEEKRKKEEEKRLKDEEKLKQEEEKLRQVQKTKEVFQNFFIKPRTVSTKVTKPVEGRFIPFELKKDMSLAPSHRRPAITGSAMAQLDDALQSQAETITYLQQLKQGTAKPVQTGRVLRQKVDVENEVELMVHDSETVKKVMHAIKLLQFHTDYRPPYYGTWRKKVKGLSPRNPWKKDESVFDYEIDSDDEWEEEEPGESLSDSNGEDDEAEGEEEDDDGWMVPHGYLSEGEGCEDDEEVTPETLKARQRAKAQAWEAELQAKKKVSPPIHLGCYWQQVSSCLSEKDLALMRQFEMVCLQSAPIDTLISNPLLVENGRDGVSDKPSSGITPSGKGFRKRALPHEAMPDLIRLVHGNPCGIKKLVREFRLFWRQKIKESNTSWNESCMEDEAMDTSGECAASSKRSDKEKCSTPALESIGDVADKSHVEDVACNTSNGPTKGRCGDSLAANDNQNNDIVSKRQLEIKIMAIANREKRVGTTKTCWYVKKEVLEEFNMNALSPENTWISFSQDMDKKTPCKTPSEKKAAKRSTNKVSPSAPSSLKKSCDNELSEDMGKSSSRVKKENITPGKPKDQPSIMNFAKKTAERLLTHKESKGPTICKRSLEMVKLQSDNSDVLQKSLDQKDTNVTVENNGSYTADCILIDD